MLVKVNSIDTVKNKVKVTLLDIDDYGSLIPLVTQVQDKFDTASISNSVYKL